MNKEEIKAYNYLKKYIEWETSGERNLEEDIKTILNLLEKQFRKIEVLETKNKILKNLNKNTYIRKDTIRKKLEEIENSNTINFTEILEFLVKISGESEK